MQFPVALIVSSNPVLAALLAALVEPAEVEIAFPQPGEDARTAVLRARPALVLADCDHPDTGSDFFVGPVLMTGASLAMFCPPSHFARERRQAVADRHGLAFFLLPDDVEGLQAWVARTADARRRDAMRYGA